MPNRFNLRDIQSAYTGLLTEAKIDDILEKSNLSPNEQIMIKHFNDQLSNKTKYINFIIKNFEDNNIDDLLYIDKYHQAFPGLDIDKATMQEVHDLVEAHKVKKEIEKIHPEAEKIFEDDDVLIISPLTYEAAVYHGKGTKWCISTSSSKHWDHYTSNWEDFYFIISKKYPITHKFSKVAVQVEQDGNINEFRDREDKVIADYNNIPIYDFNKYRQYLKPKKLTVDIIARKMKLKYNESTGLYDCDKNVFIDDRVLIKNGKLVIKFGHVKGYFTCSHCKFLNSLEGAPEEVDGSFNCSYCNITSLKGCPKKVGGFFDCRYCRGKFTKDDVRKLCDVKGNIDV